MISIKKNKELKVTFTELSDDQIRLVAILANERMWKSFADYLILENSPKLEESVRICLDIIWEKTIKGMISDDQRQKYNRMIQVIDSSSNEENPEDEFLAIYPIYLIGQLYSDMLCNDKNKIITVCSSATVRPLDMICDDLLNTVSDEMLSEHPAVIAELNRIDGDILLARDFPQNMSEVLNKKALYQTLQLVPTV